jgi:hypothetical protein
MIRITAAAPEAMMSDANHMAMAIAYSEADGLTYRAAGWQDGQGNLYAAASWEARPEWIAAATMPLQRPAWDTEQIIDMAAASRAQAALNFWMPGETPAPAASPGVLTAIGGMSGPDALAAMGLTPVEDAP